MATQPLPPLSAIADATLRASDGTQLKASALWASQPVFVYALRRPGCILCRDEAAKLWAARGELEGAGLKVVCVVHEWIEREIDAFVSGGFWGGELYHDADRAFYKVFGGGQVRTASVLSLLNPFSEAWRRISDAKARVTEHNLTGEGTILGGLLVVRAGQGGIVYARPELGFGGFPETAEIVAAAKRALVGHA